MARFKKIVHLVAITEQNLIVIHQFFAFDQYCLSDDLIEYQDQSGNLTFSNVGKCSLVKNECEHWLLICKTDLCNIRCQEESSESSSTSISSGPSTTVTVQQPSSTVPPSISRLTSSIPSTSTTTSTSTSTSATTTTEVKKWWNLFNYFILSFWILCFDLPFYALKNF
uniref:Uncharacterized protein n=1 Tax=Panagrolaimus superbus TaxID=310955 RepID=A0A914Y8F7_9BILA